MTTPAQQEREYSPELEQKAKASYDYIWKERNEFIQWIALFSAGAMYFALNMMLENHKAVKPFLALKLLYSVEVSVLCFFISLVSTVAYKWRWSVKYLFDEMDLEFLRRRVEGESADTAEEVKSELDKTKKEIKRYVRFTESAYLTALAFFVIAFIPLFFALAGLIHPRIAALI